MRTILRKITTLFPALVKAGTDLRSVQQVNQGRLRRVPSPSRSAVRATALRPLPLPLPLPLLLLLLLLSPILSGAASGDSPAVRSDSGTVDLRQPDATRLARFTADNDFIYHAPPPAAPTLWDRIVNWIFFKIYRFFFSPVYKVYRNIFIYAIFMLLLGYMVYRLKDAPFLSAFYGKSAAGRLNLQEVTENIHAMDFEALIAEAVAAGQYRRAVRLNFLKSLRLLTEKQHIHWKPEKTNRDYLEELTPSELRLPFQELATRYEYIWYGDFPVDASRYEDARLRFEQFHRQLRGQHDSR